MRPNQNTITAAFFGHPDEAARVEICGRFASVENDHEILTACRRMSATFKIWQIFLQAAPGEVAARISQLN